MKKLISLLISTAILVFISVFNLSHQYSITKKIFFALNFPKMFLKLPNYRLKMNCNQNTKENAFSLIKLANFNLTTKYDPLIITF